MDRTGVECGITPGDSQDVLVKFTDEAGQPLPETDAVALKARVMIETDSFREVMLSPKGCGRVPKNTRWLQAYLRDRRLISNLPWNAQAGERFRIVNLRSSPSMRDNYSCPTTPLFSNERLNWFVSNLNLQDRRITVEAVGEPGRFSLWSQSLAEGSEIPALDTASLPEGLYRLQIRVWALADGWPEENFTEAALSCDLVVLHRTPESRIATDSLESLVVVKQDEVLPIQAITPHTDIWACSARKSFAQSYFKQKGTCDPKLLCGDDAEFLSLVQLGLEPGNVYDIAYRAEDRAGAKSSWSCLTVVVSSSAPSLEVEWKQQELNAPEAVMWRPQAVLDARITALHKELDTGSLSRNLSCKVEFFVQGQFSRPGKGVTCLSGRCAGQELSEYRPCDSEISFSIHRALGDSAVLNSVLKLHVRADDGAGQQKTTERSILLQKQLWEPRSFVESLGPVAFLELTAHEEFMAEQLPDGRLALPVSGPNLDLRVLLFDEKLQTFGTRNPEDDLTPAQLLYLPKVGLVSAWRKKQDFDDTVETGIIRRFYILDRNNEWKLAPVMAAVPDGVACWMLFPDADGDGFLCPSTFQKKILQIKPKENAIRTLVDHFPGENCVPYLINELKSGPDGRVLMGCDNGLSELVEGKWQLRRKRSDFGTAVYDAQGNVWIHRLKPAEASLTLGYLQGATFQSVKLPPGLAGWADRSDLVADASGQIWFSTYRWDPQTSTWIQPEALKQIPLELPIRTESNNAGQLEFIDSLATVVYRDGMARYWPHKGLDMRLNGSGYGSFLLRPSGELWFRGYFGKGIPEILDLGQRTLLGMGRWQSNLPKGLIKGFWLDAQDKPHVAIDKAGVFKRSQGAWEQVSDLPDPPESLEKVVKAGSGRVYAVSQLQLWRWDRNTNQWVQSFCKFPEFGRDERRPWFALGQIHSDPTGADWLSIGYDQGLLVKMTEDQCTFFYGPSESLGRDKMPQKGELEVDKVFSWQGRVYAYIAGQFMMADQGDQTLRHVHPEDPLSNLIDFDRVDLYAAVDDDHLFFVEAEYLPYSTQIRRGFVFKPSLSTKSEIPSYSIGYLFLGPNDQFYMFRFESVARLVGDFWEQIINSESFSALTNSTLSWNVTALSDRQGVLYFVWEDEIIARFP